MMFLSYYKPAEFGGAAGGGVAVGFADVAVHAFFERGDEGFDFGFGAFGFESDASVEEVGDVAGDFVFAGDLHGGVAEADALDVSGEVDGFVVGGVGGGRGHAVCVCAGKCSGVFV